MRSWSLKKSLAVCVLIGVILFLRLYALDTYPSGFQNDEASFFYNAISLLETGKDEDGRFLPWYLHSYIDPKPALFSYLQIPFVLIGGSSTLSSRLPSALLGIGSIGLLIWLFSLLGVNKKQQWAMAILLAISPWHVLVSRSTQEVILSFFFGLASLISLATFIRSVAMEKRTWGYFWAFLLFFWLSIYAYHSAKIVLPLLSVWMMIYMGFLARFRKMSFGLMGIMLVLSLVVLLSNPAGLDRFGDIGIFSNTDMRAVIGEQIALSTQTTHPLMIRLFHNKLVYLIGVIGENYLAHFSAQFLFFANQEPVRYTIPFQGLFYLVEIMLLLLGIAVSLKQKKLRRETWFFGGWLFISPLPAAVTVQEIPSLVRSFWMIVPLVYFVARGGVYLWTEASLWGSRFVRNLLVGFVLASYGWGVLYAWHQWRVFQPQYHPWHRNYADMEMARALKNHEDRYDQVVISRFSGQPYIYLSLVGLLSVDQLQQSYPARMQDSFSLGKYTFLPGECPLGQQKGVLYVIRENCVLPAYYQRVEKVSYLDGNDGYIFVVWGKEE